MFTTWVTGLQPAAFAAQTTNTKYREPDLNRQHSAFEADASTNWTIPADTRGQTRTDNLLFLRQAPLPNWATRASGGLGSRTLHRD